MPRICFKDNFEEAMGFSSKRKRQPPRPASLISIPSIVAVEEPLSVFSQQFTHVSCEGKHLSMPIYDLMSWSKFFRDLLQTGSGEKRVELEERAETILQFRELVYSKHVTWRDSGPVPFFEQVFALTAFLDKYDCARALQDLVELLARGATPGAPFRNPASSSFSSSSSSSSSSGASSADPSRLAELPPLVLFAVGARLAQPEICEAALDLPKGSWAHYKPWTHPPGVADRYRNTLHPLGIPYALLTALPLDYTLALALTPVKECIKPGYDKDRTRHGREFAEQLARIGKLRKAADGRRDRA